MAITRMLVAAFVALMAGAIIESMRAAPLASTGVVVAIVPQSLR